VKGIETETRPEVLRAMSYRRLLMMARSGQSTVAAVGQVSQATEGTPMTASRLGCLDGTSRVAIDVMTL
jgi:hypothetical protein